MTAARISQAVVEVIRTNTAVKAQISHVVVEVLRVYPGTATRIGHVVVEVLRANGAEVPLGGAQPLAIVCS